MRFIKILSFVFALFCLCVGCKTQQATPEQLAEHQEALVALRNGCFIVQLDALYPSSASLLTPALTEYKEMRESYLKADNGAFSYYISPNDGVRQHVDFPADRKENLRAEVIESKKKRNGESRFRVKVRGEGIVDYKDIVILLDKHTNHCMVKVMQGGKVSQISMEGRILPLAE